MLCAVTLGEAPRSGKFKKALKWACHSVVGSGRSVQAILSKVASGSGLTVHDYLQDADAKGPRSAVPDPIWRAALEHTQSVSGRFRIGYAAAISENEPVAYDAWLPLAEHDHAGAMYNLGVLLIDSDPAEARRWWERAAEYDHAGAMFNLGALLEDSDPAAARHWYERAARHDHADAMYHLGDLLEDSDPAAARRWYEGAARARQRRRHVTTSGPCSKTATPPRPGAGTSGRSSHENADAMFDLGVLLNDSDPADGPATGTSGRPSTTTPAPCSASGSC